MTRRASRAGAVLMAACAAASACDPVEPVARDDAGASDAGIAPDAGTSDAGSAPDAGASDAGSAPDAGTRPDFDLPQYDAGPPVEDAGPPADAGPTCVFDDNPTVPFACEGDEDFCAPVPDRPEPSGDLLAGWSRIEGDDVVIDLRFLAAPFRLAPASEVVVVLFEHNTFPPYAVAADSTDPPNTSAQLLWGGLMVMVATDTYECVGYPPSCVQSFPEMPYDRCGAMLGVASPAMRLRVPLDLAANADGTVRYAVQVVSPDVLRGADTNWFGGPKHFETPQGGAPDGVDDLLGICEMDCSDGALP